MNSPRMNNRHDEEEVSVILKSNPDARKAFEKLEQAAKKGNAYASFEIAMHYLKGVWDLRSMQDDMLKDKLMPETTDIDQDPYLIASRNPSVALFYCRQVVEYDKPTNLSLVLALQKSTCYQVLNAFDIEKNPNQKNNAYMKTSYCRPTNMKNSISSLFANTAYRCLQFIGIFSVVPLLYNFLVIMMWFAGFFSSFEDNIGANNIGISMSLFGLIVFFPTVIVGFVLFFYGVTKSQPCCSCKNIRSAYIKTISRLPDSFTAHLNNPFKETNWLVSHTISIYMWYCAFGLIFSVLIIAFELESPNKINVILAFISLISFALNIVAVRNVCFLNNNNQDYSLSLFTQGIII